MRSPPQANTCNTYDPTHTSQRVPSYSHHTCSTNAGGSIPSASASASASASSVAVSSVASGRWERYRPRYCSPRCYSRYCSRYCSRCWCSSRVLYAQNATPTHPHYTTNTYDSDHTSSNVHADPSPKPRDHNCTHPNPDSCWHT